MENKRPKLSIYKKICCPNCYSEIELNLAQRRKEEPIKCSKCSEVTELAEAEKFLENMSAITEGPCPNCDTRLIFEVKERVKDALIECVRCKDKFYLDEVDLERSIKTDYHKVSTKQSTPTSSSGKYTGLSIVAFIFALLAPPLGFILGIVAKNEIKNTGEGNDGLATLAIVIGLIWGIVMLALIAPSY